MDRADYWKTHFQIIGQVIGFIGAAWALPLGMNSLAAGIAYGSLEGYLASALAFGSGYVLARRAWNERVDWRFALGFVVLLGVSIFIVGYLETPPSVFQRIGNW